MRFWAFALCSVSAWAGNASVARIQEAATKAVSIIQHSQKNWYATQTCYSCHQQVFPALAFQAAREPGIAVNAQAAHADAAAAFGFYANLERAVEYSYIIDPALGDGYALMGAHAGGRAPEHRHCGLRAPDCRPARAGWALGVHR